MPRRRDPIPGVGIDTERNINKVTGDLQDRVSILERKPGRPGFVSSDTAAKPGEFLNIEAPPTGLTVILPEAVQSLRNERVTFSMRNANPVRIVCILGTVNRVPFVLNTAIGTFEAICDGLGNWSVETGLSSSGSASDAHYLLGQAHGSLPNGSVAQDTTFINFAYTPGTFATWTWLGALIQDDNVAQGSASTFDFTSTTSIITTAAVSAGEVVVTNQRAALTGAISASQNSNATLFAGIRDNGSSENDRTNLNFLTSTSIVAAVADDAGNDELELTWQRAALTGAIAASQNSNATLFAGIRDNGSAENDRTSLNFISGTGTTSTVTDDSVSDELEIRIDWNGVGVVVGEAGSGTFRTLTFQADSPLGLNFADLGGSNVEIRYSLQDGDWGQVVTSSGGTVWNLDTSVAGAGLSGAGGSPLDVNGSTSIVVTSDQVQRAALTGAVAASQNSNATLFAGIRDNGSAENDRTSLNFLSTTSVVAAVTDDAGSDELELTWQRAALTGAISASQNSNATLFAGIQVDTIQQTARTNFNFLSSTSIVWTGSDSAVNDRINIFADRAALTGAIAASQGSNSTKFAGILVGGVGTTDRTNINFVDGAGAQFSATDDAANDEIEITVTAIDVVQSFTTAGTSNDVALNDLTTVLRVDTGNSTWRITGFSGTLYHGRKLKVMNASNSSSVGGLLHSTGSSAGNQISTPFSVERYGNRYAAILEYDGTDSVWRVISENACAPFSNTSSNALGDVLAHNGTDWSVVAGGNNPDVYLAGDGTFKAFGRPEIASDRLLWMDEDFDGSLTGAPVNSPATAGNGTEIRAGANWRVGSSIAVAAAGSVSRVDGEAGHHGTIQLTTNSTSNTKAGVFLPLGTGSSVAHTSSSLTASQVTAIEFWLFIPTITNIVVMCGIGDQPLTSTGQSSGTRGLNWVFAPASNSDWVCFNRNSSSSSATSTTGATVAANTWYRMGIHQVSSSEINYYVNGQLEAVITTNIPTSDVTPYVSVQTLTSAARTVLIDRVRIWYDTGGMQL